MIKRIFCVLIASVLMIFTNPFVLAEGVDNIPDGIPSLDPYYTDEYIICPCESTDRASYIIDQTVSISSMKMHYQRQNYIHKGGLFNE
jgi:hypothetical protein